MTEQEARDFVRDNWDNDQISDDDVESCFVAIFGREPDDEDCDLWSQICSVVCTDEVGNPQ